MKKSKYAILISVAIFILSFLSGCNSPDENNTLEDFSINSTSGYSLEMTIIPKKDPKNDRVLTSINLFVAVRNHNKDINGTITSWTFKIRRNIVTIVEINQNNYNTYKLKTSGTTFIPADEITEFYVETPQPFKTNAIPENIFTFAPYVPTEVIVELKVTDDNGTIHDVTATGSYTFEQQTEYED
jgi:hypothetical protein